MNPPLPKCLSWPLQPLYSYLSLPLCPTTGAGPLIRTWCMTFEAMLQLLKKIAHNSNYKNVICRLARIYGIRQYRIAGEGEGVRG